MSIRKSPFVSELSEELSQIRHAAATKSQNRARDMHNKSIRSQLRLSPPPQLDWDDFEDTKELMASLHDRSDGGVQHLAEGEIEVELNFG